MLQGRLSPASSFENVVSVQFGRTDSGRTSLAKACGVLEIVDSRSLKVLIGLENLKTLQQLKLTDMSKKFIATIEETKVRTWANLALLIRRPW